MTRFSDLVHCRFPRDGLGSWRIPTLCAPRRRGRASAAGAPAVIVTRRRGPAYRRGIAPMGRKILIPACVGLLLGSAVCVANAADEAKPSPAQVEFFETKVRPV